MEVGQIGLHGADVTLTAGKLETGFAIILLHFLMELIVLETVLSRTIAMEKIVAQVQNIKCLIQQYNLFL